MRKQFVNYLIKKMEKDKRIWVLVGDTGQGILDEIKEKFPNRFFNCGCSEQNMIGVAAGLSLIGIIPVVYSITPFLLYRPYEFIRNLIDNDNTNVKLVGSGRGDDYGLEGFTHWSLEQKQILKSFKNIKYFFPTSKVEIPIIVDEMFNNNKPYYLNLSR